MTLSKEKKLRKMEIIFSDGEINPICHCEYDTIILEDGEEIHRKKHRENMEILDAKRMVQEAKLMQPTEEQI